MTDQRETGGMRIVTLEAQNVKRLRAVRIEPDGRIVRITGRNCQGKSSVLDSIIMGLGGGKTIPSSPVRSGELEAKIRIEIGDGKPDIVVERTIGPDGKTSLKMTRANGDLIPRPQTTLDEIIGELAFDPGAFSRMKPRDQYDMIAQMVGVDIAAHEAAIEKAEQKRLELGRERKQKVAAFEGMKPLSDPGEVPSIAALQAKRAEAEATSARVRNEERSAEENRRQTAEYDRMIEKFESDIADMQKRLATAQEMRSKTLEMQKERDARIETAKAAVIPVEPIDEEIRAVVDKQKAKTEFERYEAARDALKPIIAAHEEADAAVDAARTAYTQAVEAVKMPVDGLTIERGTVFLNGVPMDQCSASERLSISVQMAIALNPRLRVMLLHDASLYDTDALAMLAQIAEQQDMQIWIEIVAGENPTGIIIEDGEVVEGAKQ